MDSLHTNFRSELATGLVAEGETVMVDGASSLFEDLGVAIFNRKADFSKHDAVWFDDDHNFEQAMKTLLEVKDKLLRIDSRVTMMSAELSKAEVAEYVPALVAVLACPTLKSNERESVMRVLRAGRTAVVDDETIAQQVESIMQLFDTKSEDVARSAVSLLSRIGTPLMEHSDQFIQLLRHEMALVRKGAIEQLKEMTRHQRDYVKDHLVMLKQVLEDAMNSSEDSEIVGSILNALRLADLTLEERGLLCKTLLDSGKTAAMTAALEELASMDVKALSANAEFIIANMGHEEKSVRDAAWSAIKNISDPDALARHGSILAKLLEHDAADVRQRALLVLSKLNPPERAAFAASIVAKLNDASLTVGKAAALALCGNDAPDGYRQSMKGLPHEALQPHTGTVVALLHHCDTNVRTLALKTLKAAGQAEEERKSTLLQERGCSSLPQLKAKGSGVDELIASGYELSEVSEICSPWELVSRGYASTALAWRAVSHFRFNGHVENSQHLALAEDGLTAFSAGSIGVGLASNGIGAIAINDLKALAPLCHTSSSPNQDAVFSVATSGGVVAAGCRNGDVHLFSVQASKLLSTIATGDEKVAIALQDDLLVSGGLGKVSQWSISNNKRTAQLNEHTGRVNSVGIGRDVVVSGDANGTIKVWPVGGGPVRFSMRGSRSISEIMALDVDATNARFAVGCKNGGVSVWSLETGQATHSRLSGHGNAVRSVSLCDNTLFTSSDDATIKVWKLTGGGSLITTLEEGGRSSVVGVSVLPNGTIVSCNTDGKAVVWRHGEEPSDYVNFLSHSEASVRELAAEALCKLDPDALAPFIEPVLALLATEDAGVPPSENTKGGDTDSVQKAAPASPAVATAAAGRYGPPGVARAVRASAVATASRGEQMPAALSVLKVLGEPLHDYAAKVIHLTAHKKAVVRTGALHALKEMEGRREGLLREHLETITQALMDAVASSDDPEALSSVLSALRLAGLADEDRGLHCKTLLDSGKTAATAAALEELGALNVATLSANAQAIVAHMGHEEKSVRDAAWSALKKLKDGEALARHGDALARLLQHDTADVRQRVLKTLHDLEQSALTPHVPAIVATLDDPSENVRTEALELLQKLTMATLKPHLAVIVAVVANDTVDVRVWAIEMFGKLEPSELAPYAAPIATRVNDPEMKVRIAVLKTLGQLEPAALAMHASQVVAKLDDDDFSVVTSAAPLLDKLEAPILGIYAGTIIEKLDDLRAKDTHLSVTKNVEKALAKLSVVQLAPHVAGLAKKLAAAASQERLNALKSLQSIPGAALGTCAAAIAAALDDADKGVRQEAVKAMGHLEMADLSTHAAAVASRLEDSESSVQLASLATLAKVEPSTLAQHGTAISAKLNPNTSSSALRKEACKTLACLEPSALGAYDAAIAAQAGDSEESVRKEAIKTLGKLEGAPLTRQLGVIATAFDDSAVLVRKEAAAALGALPASLTSESVKSLVDKLEAEQATPAVMTEALQALSSFSSDALSPHGAALMSKIEHSEEGVRKDAVSVLSKFAEGLLTPHLPTAVKQLSHESTSFRATALQALKAAGQTEEERKTALMREMKCTSLVELKEKGSAGPELVAAGFSSEELKAAGIEAKPLPQWAPASSLFAQAPPEGFGREAGEFHVGQLVQINIESLELKWCYGKIMDYDAAFETYAVMTRGGPHRDVPRSRLTDDVVANPHDGSCAQQ